MFKSLLQAVVTNWKTTAVGALTIAVNILPIFGVEINPRILQAITTIVGGGGLIVAHDPKRQPQPSANNGD
jgi:hypothetical protein